MLTIDNNNRKGSIPVSRVLESEEWWALCLFDMFSGPGTPFEAELEEAEDPEEGLEASGANWGYLSHHVLFTLHATRLLPRKWQDLLSNKTEFCTVLRRRFIFLCCWISFQWASCQHEENETLDFSTTASGIIIRDSRNNCFGRSQLHFILTVKES